MKHLNNNELMQQINEIIDMINVYEFQDMETVYVSQLEKIKADLPGNYAGNILAYFDHLDNLITDLKLRIIERFSVHNKHLTVDYMNQLIQNDRILFAQLDHTTKVDDCEQYLLAKEQYSLKYKEYLTYKYLANL